MSRAGLAGQWRDKGHEGRDRETRKKGLRHRPFEERINRHHVYEAGAKDGAGAPSSRKIFTANPPDASSLWISAWASAGRRKPRVGRHAPINLAAESGKGVLGRGEVVVEKNGTVEEILRHGASQGGKRRKGEGRARERFSHFGVESAGVARGFHVLAAADGQGAIHQLQHEIFVVVDLVCTSSDTAEEAEGRTGWMGANPSSKLLWG